MMDNLNYLEIPIVEYCNLNCKGCSHFSSLAKKDDCLSYEEIKRDVIRLKELIPNILQIRILGGEPLLHRDLIRVLKCIREVYSRSEIRVVTNGLLLPKMENDFWATLRDYGIGIDISMYKSTFHNLSKILDVLKKENANYKCTDLIEKFRKRMVLNPQDSASSNFQNCPVGSNCTCLYKGGISACPAPFVIRHFNSYFNTNINGDNDILNIFQSDISKEYIFTFLKRPLNMCAYCTSPQEFNWEIKNIPEIQDWVIKE